MLEQDRISKEISDLRSGNKTIVFTNGCFDLLHQGHIDLISMSSTFGNILVVGLNSCLLYTSPSPRDGLLSRMPSSA